MSTAKAVEEFVDGLGTVLSEMNVAKLTELFLTEGWYKDILVTEWDFNAVSAQEVGAFFSEHGFPSVANVRLDPTLSVGVGSSPVNGGEVFTTSYLVFDIPKIGDGRGFLRLKPDASGHLKIYSLFLCLYSLLAHRPAVGHSRPKGIEHNHPTQRPNWLDERRAREEFLDEEPVVVIVGAGQGGLMIAARLAMGGVRSLILEKSERVGDSWRKRYKSLVLHDPVWADHFPYFPYPAHWPVFTPKDKLADWFETYVQVMELNVWTKVTILPGTSYSDETGLWSLPIRRADGSERKLHPKHIVQATGASGEPYIPRWLGMETFGGKLTHSSGHGGGQEWMGKKAIIVGCCNSGHDIAQDLWENGADVTMVQRSSTLVISSDPALTTYLKGAYEEDGPYVEDADLMVVSQPILLMERFHVALNPTLQAMDAEIHAGLTKAGFKLDPESNSGLFMKYYRRGGGYYIDVGCSKLIADGKIKIKQGVEVESIKPDGVKFADGQVLLADLIVLATGYDSMQTTCQKIFGDAIADRTGPVWGVDAQGEIQGIWRNSGHPGFWYMGGNFQLARTYSRFLALQIMAIEDGLAPKNRKRTR